MKINGTSVMHTSSPNFCPGCTFVMTSAISPSFAASLSSPMEVSRSSSDISLV